MFSGPQIHRILVTDAEQRAALAVVRSLGSAGHTVYVSSAQKRPLAAASKYVEASFSTPAPLNGPTVFTDAIAGIVAAHGIDVLIPMTEPSLLALLPNLELLPNVVVPFADAPTFARISDKEEVLGAAAKVGIHVPRQSVLENAAALEHFDILDIRYPVVVKPARSVAGGSGDRVKLSVQHAASAAELRSILGELDPRAFPILLQQRVVGPGVGIFVLVWDGELVASFAHERIREKPPSGGISVYRKSVPVDAELLRLSLELLASFSWQGVAMIEYKIDRDTGTPYLMEINGRFWGSLQLAIDSGIDFPRLLLGAATGSTPAPVATFREGVRSRWFWGDVDHLLARLRKSRERLSLPPGAPPPRQVIRDFFTRHPNDVNEILRRDDWRPFLRESLQWFRDLAG